VSEEDRVIPSYADPARLGRDEAGRSCPMLTVGLPSTLGVWYDLTKATFGDDSPAVAFWQQKIDDHAKGRDEWVVSDEGQTLYLTGQIHRHGLPS
jgi:hypothetical protein